MNDDTVVDVVIPVYRGLAETRRCIESVLASRQLTRFRTVVIDDATPDAQIAAYLDALARAGDITLLRNERNLGFVRSVNRGVFCHPDRDVVLLNSDTEVANDWLDRLRRCAYSQADIGTVTPLSNNATICSYPFPGWTGGVPGGLGLRALDRVVANANAGQAVDLPTAIGFCMYIRRACLDRVGPFDAARYGKGYGEENDFCRRAIRAGWRNVLAADVFVFHEGNVSFRQERFALQQAAAAALLETHPDYFDDVNSFIARDPIAPLRAAIDNARIQASPDEAQHLERERRAAQTSVAPPDDVGGATSDDPRVPSESDRPAHQPLVSVIIRSMGRPTLSKALSSLEDQTYRRLEIVVVNALGSGHPPLPAFGDMQGDRSRWNPLRPQGGEGRERGSGAGDMLVRFIDSAHRLPRAVAANVGLDAAQGELAIYLDDDDWFDAGHIQSLVEALNGHPDAVAAYSGVRCVEDDAAEPVRIYNDAFDAVRLLVENYIPLHALMFRREVCKAHPECRFDESLDMFEDWDFWLHLLEHGGFVHQPAITAVYRIHEGGGAGVHANQATALAAFDKLLAKWRRRWQPEQLRDLVARQRLLGRLLDEHRAQLSERDARLIAIADHTSRLEAAIRDRDERIEAQRSQLEDQRLQLDSQRRDLEQTQDLLVKTSKRLEEIEATWPGRLARKWTTLRRKTATARRLAAEGRKKELAWRLLLNVYGHPAARRVVAVVPFTWKRSVRDYFSRSMSSPELPEFSGRLSEQPLVSIIIPVYQHADYIRRCITSALDQTYPNVEVIVVDDASPDVRVAETLDLLEGHPRLRILRNVDNMGISRTQNAGLLASRGEIIGFLDCDDYLAADAVEACLRYWNAQTVYSHSARINVDAEGNEVNRICFRHLPRADYFAENLEAMYATHFKMIRRDVFARLGLFDPRFDTAQDYDYLMRVAAHYPSDSFAYVPHFVYYHRFHAGQATETANARQAEAVAQIRKEAQLRRAIQGGQFDKRLSFIMLSFGKHSQTLQAIESLKRTVSVPHEIILFDNGSDAETAAFLKDRIEGRFDDLRVFYSDVNLGPAAGRREALRHATGDWFVTFDNDEVAEPGWLEELIVRASSDSRIGAVTCKVIFPDRRLQCCGGYIDELEEDIIELQLYGRGLDAYDLRSAMSHDCDWCPIGATLFTINPAEFMHAGYPNVFEDVGVSMAMRRKGYRLVNSPGSWVWHEHITFRRNAEMAGRYTAERYDPKRMLISVASFYRENGKIIRDKYVWRENELERMSLPAIRQRLEQLAQETYPLDVAAAPRQGGAASGTSCQEPGESSRPAMPHEHEVLTRSRRA